MSILKKYISKNVNSFYKWNVTAMRINIQYLVFPWKIQSLVPQFPQKKWMSPCSSRSSKVFFFFFFWDFLRFSTVFLHSKWSRSRSRLLSPETESVANEEILLKSQHSHNVVHSLPSNNKDLATALEIWAIKFSIKILLSIL